VRVCWTDRFPQIHTVQQREAFEPPFLIDTAKKKLHFHLRCGLHHTLKILAKKFYLELKYSIKNKLAKPSQYGNIVYQFGYKENKKLC